MEWMDILRGLLGILTLISIGFGLSFAKRQINWRLIGVGLGLQFLFALIILRESTLSFVGMGILGLLIINYMWKDEFPDLPQWESMTLVSLISAGVGAFLVVINTSFGLSLFFSPETVGALLAVIQSGLGYLVGGSLVALFVVHYFDQRQVSRGIGALFLISGVAFLFVHNYHGQYIFKTLSTKVSHFLSLSDYGAEFLFGNLAKDQQSIVQGGEYWPGFGVQFAFRVLPTILFFGGFMSILYYLGLIQKVVIALSRFMRWIMGTSGAETLSCSANIFVGQTEAPLLIKPFLKNMTRSELLTIMVGGFATIAGGVLAGFIAMGISAGHLIAASVMSAPAALVVGKLIYPELEHSETAGDVEMPEIKSGSNVIESATNGIMDGLKLAVNVGAMLIGFIALIAVLDLALNWMDSIIDGQWLGGEYIKYESDRSLSPAKGEFIGYFPGSMQTLFGTLLRPLAWLMGVPWQDANLVGNLLGIKLTLNEFVAYSQLGNYLNSDMLGEKAEIISTYALCGFANLSSIGIQIGGISALVPSRKSTLAKLALKAMFGGAIASWITATIAGVLVVG